MPGPRREASLLEPSEEGSAGPESRHDGGGSPGVYRCFNKMTTVCIDGRSCYVDGFAAGSVLLGQDDSHNLFVRENRGAVRRG